MPKRQACLTSIFVIGSCLATYAAADLSEKTERHIGNAIEQEMENQQVIGVALGIVVDGEIVYLNGFGYADLKTEKKVDQSSMFRWASISKPVTAIAAMQLVEQGKLDLDEDIRTYVPEFPDKGVKITARQLLCHQGGIVHYQNGKVVETKRTYEVDHPFESVVLALDKFKDSSLINDPGTAFSYSTHGFMLLSAVVERAGGKPYLEQVRERILEPLEMNTMQPDYPWVDIPNRVSGYLKVRKGPRPSREVPVHWKLGGGGYISSIDDLTKFAKGLLGGELVSSETLTMMWTDQPNAAGEATGMGLGFFVGGEGQKRTVQHSGSQNKTKTSMMLAPERNIAVTFMSNSEYTDLAPFLLPIFDILKEE